jgi:hypothetical protein
MLVQPVVFVIPSALANRTKERSKYLILWRIFVQDVRVCYPWFDRVPRSSWRWHTMKVSFVVCKHGTRVEGEERLCMTVQNSLKHERLQDGHTASHFPNSI